MMNGGIRSMLQVKANLCWDTRNDEPTTSHQKQQQQHIMPIVVVKDSGRLSSCLVRAIEIFESYQNRKEKYEKQKTDSNNKGKNLSTIDARYSNIYLQSKSWEVKYSHLIASNP